MSITATIYERATGRLLRVITVPDNDCLLANIGADEWGLGEYAAVHEWYLRDGQLVRYPVKPGPWAVYDFAAHEWRDPRSLADLQAEMARRRRAAGLDKSDLLIALVGAGILTSAEAEEAASGIIPARIAAMLDTLPADAQMAARIKWRSDTTISRMHPVIVAAAYALGVADTALDAVFGITPVEGVSA